MECLFCSFIKKKREHNGGYPFLVLNETENTVSFLSTDFPRKEDGHVLIIPKKHFKNIGDVPKKTLHELIEHVSLFAKVLRKNHEGCNILLNDGYSAQQRIFHVHFHIIPRDKRDGIIMKLWKRKKMPIGKFIELSKSLKKDVEKYAKRKS